MKRLVPLESVVVVREGARVTPPLGKPFDFTDAEALELAEKRPEAVRKAVNEGEAGDDMLDLPEDDLSGGGDDDEIEAANAEAATKKKAAKVKRSVAKHAGVKVDDL